MSRSETLAARLATWMWRFAGLWSAIRGVIGCFSSSVFSPSTTPFGLPCADASKGVVDGLNALLEKHPITPRIADHNPANLHIHVANRAASVSDLLVGESLLGLANLVCDLGPTRLGICSAAPCTNVYVDTSPNQSRRYCSDRCSSRANVAAYRARQKLVSAGAPNERAV